MPLREEENWNYIRNSSYHHVVVSFRSFLLCAWWEKGLVTHEIVVKTVGGWACPGPFPPTRVWVSGKKKYKIVSHTIFTPLLCKQNSQFMLCVHFTSLCFVKLSVTWHYMHTSYHFVLAKFSFCYMYISYSFRCTQLLEKGL